MFLVVSEIFDIFGLKITQCFENGICLYLELERKRRECTLFGPSELISIPGHHLKTKADLASKTLWIFLIQMMDNVQNTRNNKEQNYCTVVQLSMQYPKINYVNPLNHSLCY